MLVGGSFEARTTHKAKHTPVTQTSSAQAVATTPHVVSIVKYPQMAGRVQTAQGYSAAGDSRTAMSFSSIFMSIKANAKLTQSETCAFVIMRMFSGWSRKEAHTDFGRQRLCSLNCG